MCVFFDLAVKASKDPAFKKLKKKKKVLKKQPKQKSAFKLKTTKKPRAFPHHAAKLKPKPKSKPIPKPKHKTLPKLKPKPKSKVYSQHQPLPNYKVHLKVHSSGTPYGHRHPSVSGTSRPISQLQIQSHFKSKSWQTIPQNRELSQSGPSQLKSKTQLKLHLKSKSKRTLPEYQNMSLPETTLPQIHPTTQFRFQPPQPVWDTSVQAAIRVGDWKLLTGDPGHGDWVPPQVLVLHFRSR